MAKYNYACDNNGNMNELTSSSDRMRKHPQKTAGNSLVKKIIGGALILTGVGIGAYKLTDYAIKSDRTSYSNGIYVQNEDIPDRRARLLSQAQSQLFKAKTPEEMNGLNLIIQNIENGVYDHSQ
jgi:hypothetical protein